MLKHSDCEQKLDMIIDLLLRMENHLNWHFQPTPIYEVSVRDAAEALCIAENTIRMWDRNGCPFDASYPGRFKAAVFYQWAISYKSLRNFEREAKKRATALNTSEISILRK